MACALSIKGVPDPLVKALRHQAAQNRRSMQGELMHILETAVRRPRPFPAAELVRRIRAIGLPESPAESVAMVREMRDRR